jgi:hypothetical protein
MLYHIVCRLNHDYHYTRNEIDEIIRGATQDHGRNGPDDIYYHVDTLRRNLIDVGYLNRDPHNDIYWLQPSKASQPATT